MNEIHSSKSQLPELPRRAIERLGEVLGDDFDSAIASFSNERIVAFRVNTLKSSEEEVLNAIADSELSIEPIAWCPQSFIIKQGTIRGLQALDVYKEGKIYIQSTSSMLATHVLRVEEGLAVLDMCAAPGSKTTLIAALMQNQGRIIANDRSKKRLYRLREILQQQGATNVEVINEPAESLGRIYADCYDRVLVDVPCSGEGRFRVEKPIRMSRWSEQSIKTLAKLQQQILASALRCVKVGGRIVYSTCTFAPEENEMVLDKVLKKKSINAELIEVSQELLPPAVRTPLTSFQDWSASTDLSHAIRIIPNDLTTGFFIAVLKRLG